MRICKNCIKKLKLNLFPADHLMSFCEMCYSEFDDDQQPAGQYLETEVLLKHLFNQNILLWKEIEELKDLIELNSHHYHKKNGIEYEIVPILPKTDTT